MILGAPRTGTNYLVGLLNQLPGVRFYGEVFANEYAFTCDSEDVRRVAERTGCMVRHSPADTHVRQLFHDEPTEVVEALLDRGSDEGHDLVGVKVFGYHLPRDEVRRLVDMCTIEPIVVKRRIIDSYISRLKANKINKWLNADTSRVKVEADIRDFEYFVKRHSQWYLWLRELGLPTLYYERDILDHEPCEVVRNINDLLYTELPEINVNTLKKQDRSERYSDTVTNWDEFVSELEKRGLWPWAKGHFT